MRSTKDIIDFVDTIPDMLGRLFMPIDRVDFVSDIKTIISQWREYKNLEEKGKLLKLLCKLGDTTFWISDEDENGNKIPAVKENNPIVGIAIQEDGLYILADGDSEYQKVGTIWVFLTREEAESALKKYKID